MKPRLPWVTLSVAAAAIAIHPLPAAADWLQFDRAALGRGEVWRWLTAHLVHFGGDHLGWDVAVLLAVGASCERRSRVRCAAALGLGALAITPALWIWQPQFAFYRGLSGLDCALVGLLAASLFKHGRWPATVGGAFVLTAFAAKSVYEMSAGQTVFATGAGYVPVPLAHLVGLAAGLVTALWPARDVTPSSPSSRETVALAS